MIVDKETGWVEPTITINGVELSFAEAMSVRVAISSFKMFVSAEETRDTLGHRLADGYCSHLATIEGLMIRRTL